MKATGSKEFQEFGPRDVKADFLVWIAFGSVFENESEDTIRIYVLDEPRRVFPNGTKITLTKFKEQAAGKLTSYEAKLSDLINGKVVRIPQQATSRLLITPKIPSGTGLSLGLISGGSFEQAANHTKIGTQITTLALELLKQHPDGIRYVDLVNEISKKDARLNVSTIRGNVWNLHAKFPDKVFKPAYGLFRLTEFRDEETGEPREAAQSAAAASKKKTSGGRGAAEQGAAAAQYDLGNMHREGEGVPQDDAEAVKWYRRAADQGNASAQFNLGVMYAKGQGVPKDDTEAVKWYRRAADQGFAAPSTVSGLCTTRAGACRRRMPRR